MMNPFLVASLIVSVGPHLNQESTRSYEVRNEIKYLAEQYYEKQKDIGEILHFPGTLSDPEAPCADFATTILEGAGVFNGSKTETVNAASHYRYMIERGWEPTTPFALSNIPTFESGNEVPPKPEGCLVYYLARTGKRTGRIHHVGIIDEVSGDHITIIDASGAHDAIMKRRIDSPDLTKIYSHAIIVCPT